MLHGSLARIWPAPAARQPSGAPSQGATHVATLALQDRPWQAPCGSSPRVDAFVLLLHSPFHTLPIRPSASHCHVGENQAPFKPHQTPTRPPPHGPSRLHPPTHCSGTEPSPSGPSNHPNPTTTAVGTWGAVCEVGRAVRLLSAWQPSVGLVHLPHSHSQRPGGALSAHQRQRK